MSAFGFAGGDRLSRRCRTGRVQGCDQRLVLPGDNLPVGVLKNLMIEWQERGYGPIEGAVCTKHMHDGYLRERITELGTEACTYCGAPGAASLEDVMVYVKRAVDEYYVPAISHLSWDAYTHATDSEDVLLRIVEDDFDEAVFKDIVEAFSQIDEPWIPLAEDGGFGDSWLGAGWARFRRWVTTRSRFLLEPPSEEDHEFGEVPQEMLREIGELIVSHGLLTTLPSGTSVYRARIPLVGEHDLLIEVEAASTNRSDWKRLTGKPLYVRCGAVDDLIGRGRSMSPTTLPLLRDTARFGVSGGNRIWVTMTMD